jgi:hypothetical protein
LSVSTIDLVINIRRSYVTALRLKLRFATMRFIIAKGFTMVLQGKRKTAPPPPRMLTP